MIEASVQGFFVEKYCWENEENLNIERFDSSMKS